MIKQTTNETNHQMSGIYNTAITANTNDNQIFTGEMSEFGLPVFSDLHTQATYRNFEDEYKKKHILKQAYDKQEFLRRMRADIKREYLTRKKQVKRLQKDAAVDFRNAEFSLQEHYAGARAHEGQFHYGVRAVDINAPLVSQVTLPDGQLLNLKTFRADSEFAKVVEMHKNLIEERNESYRQWIEQEQRQRQWEAANTTGSWGQWMQRQPQQDPSTPRCNQRLAPPCWDPNFSTYESGSAATRLRGAFGGCYDYNTDEEQQLQEEEDNEDTEILDCLQIPDEPASTGSSAITATKFKKSHNNKKNKKPRNKQQQQKIVPLKVTENTNRSNDVKSMPSAGCGDVTTCLW